MGEHESPADQSLYEECVAVQDNATDPEIPVTAEQEQAGLDASPAVALRDYEVRDIYRAMAAAAPNDRDVVPRSVFNECTAKLCAERDNALLVASHHLTRIRALEADKLALVYELARRPAVFTSTMVASGRSWEGEVEVGLKHNPFRDHTGKYPWRTEL